MTPPTPALDRLLLGVRPACLAASLALAAVAGACGGDGDGDGRDGGADRATASIGPQGGTIEIEGARLVIPPGALEVVTEITIERTGAASPDGIVAMSPIYRFTPAGLAFAVPASVQLTFEGALDAAAVYWTRAGGDGFERLGGVADGAAIEAPIDHFCEGFVGDGDHSAHCAGSALDGCALQDQFCDPILGEYCDTCPEDCGPCRRDNPGDGYCGDRTCDEEFEDLLLCPSDCGGCSFCGDGRCMSGEETLETCPDDCKQPPPVGCGDRTCDPTTESEDSCPEDCAAPAFCGDGDCDPERGEDLTSCLDDCYHAPDGTCDPDETQLTQPADCTDVGCPPDGCGDAPEWDGAESLESFNQRLANWNCDPIRASECDPNCVTMGFRYSLLLSRYVVKNTARLGHHQGLGVFREQLEYSRRNGRLCRQRNRGISYLYNHGRTVNTDINEDGRPNYNVIGAKEAGSAEIPYTSDLDTARRDSLSACMYVIGNFTNTGSPPVSDGFCDNICGNDGYTLPAGWAHAEVTGCPPALFTSKQEYVGAADGCSFRAGFLGVYGFTQTIPRFGHNSNNDAEAEYAWFNACDTTLAPGDVARTPQDWLDANAPAICAAHCDRYPVPACRSQSNIAKAKVDFCPDCTNLPSDLTGDFTRSAPGDQPQADCFDRGDYTACPAGDLWWCSFTPGKLVQGM